MSEYLIKEKTLTDIADAIREKRNLSFDISPVDMAELIKSINQEYYDIFWDSFQQSGRRTDYSYAFAGKGWFTDLGTYESADVFCNCNPKYLIKPTNAAYMFYGSTAPSDLEYWSTDIANGVDWSDNQSLASTFQNNTSIYNIGEIGASITINNAFNGCVNLAVISNLKLPIYESIYAYMNAFKGCSSLEILNLEGRILHNNFDVSDSPLLQKLSIMNIINALADKTNDTSETEWVCTIGEENLAKLTDDEIAIATEKGWVLR